MSIKNEDLTKIINSINKMCEDLSLQIEKDNKKITISNIGEYLLIKPTYIKQETEEKDLDESYVISSKIKMIINVDGNFTINIIFVKHGQLHNKYTMNFKSYMESDEFVLNNKFIIYILNLIRELILLEYNNDDDFIEKCLEEKEESVALEINKLLGQ